MFASSRRAAPAAALIAAIVVAAPRPVASQQSFRRGALTPFVVSRADPAQEYDVYVPSRYDGRTPAPVLFVMDARGRARQAADLFVPAAERFGWIVMSSHDTASDRVPLPTVAALQAMWADAHDLFAVDSRRAYLAGLSGTARTATWLASSLPGTFAGVIGAAAGFAPAAPPSAGAVFPYFGTVGDADYNYWEMDRLHGRLTDLEFPHRIEVFPGSHGWMPLDLAGSAVEWLELGAMRAGLRPVDPALVEARWARDVGAAADFEAAGKPLEALRLLRAIARDYRGFGLDAALAAIRAHVARLQRSDAVRAEARAHEVDAAVHDRRVGAALAALAGLFPAGAHAPARPLAATLLELDLPDLIADARGADDAALAARRVLAEIDVQTGLYLPLAALQSDDDLRAAFYLDIAAAIEPEDAEMWYLRARLHARAHRDADALAALARAVQLGFRMLDALEAEDDFDALRGRREFREILRAALDGARR